MNLIKFYKYLLFGLLMIFYSLTINKVNAQSFCSTPNTTQNASFEGFIQGMNATGPFYLKIYVHVIRRSNGTGGQSKQDVYDALSYLYEDFKPHNIYFVWDCQIDYIDKNSWFQGPNTGIYSVNNHYDGIDIYLFPSTTSAAGGRANGVGTSSEFYVSGTWPAFGRVAQSSIISHEMGHVINLWHTHHGCELGGTWELTNGSNCSIAGDFVCDTPADPHLGFNVNANTCEWSGIAACSAPEPLSSYSPDEEVIMAYTFPGCMEYFTAGQGQRMRNSIASLPYLQATISNHTISCCSKNLTLSNTVNSGESDIYTVDNWIKSTASINNGANITYDAGDKIYLQTGFQAASGSKFHAFIGGCGGATSNRIGNDKSTLIIETSTDFSFNAYPSPAKGMVKLEFEEEINPENIVFSNLLGQAVSVPILDRSEFHSTFDVSNLTGGIYLVTVINNKWESKSIKLIIE